MDKMIYLDNAATTQTLQEVVDEMLPYYTKYYGNPSSIYHFSNEPEMALENTRGIIAKTLGADPREIYFTGGGSESDNWALISIAQAQKKKGNHIITSKIEHHAVLHTCEYLETQGFEVTYLDVDEFGLISPGELRSAIRPETILVSIMFANNEIGTIEPIEKLAAEAREKGVIFHTDAVQAYAHMPIDVQKLGIDLLSASAHKFNGPKGVGFLYVRKGIRIPPFIHGGAQENGKRAGTENVPGIVGMGKAAKIAHDTMTQRYNKELELRNHLIDRVISEFEHVRLNGPRTERLSNNANFCFRFIEGEALLMRLDRAGICASSGSACTSGSLDPSHVLLAIGLPHEIAHGSLRISLSHENTIEEMDYVVDSLKEIVEGLREMSPLYEDYIKNNKE